MAILAFNTAFNQKGRTDRVSVEGPFSKTKTVQSGWMPVSMQVKRLELAGMRLQAYREAVYDFKPGHEVPEGVEDPTRKKGYDLADATADFEGAMERLRASMRASRADVAAMQEGKKVPVREPAAEEVSEEPTE